MNGLFRIDLDFKKYHTGLSICDMKFEKFFITRNKEMKWKKKRNEIS